MTTSFSLPLRCHRYHTIDAVKRRVLVCRKGILLYFEAFIVIFAMIYIIIIYRS